MNCKVSVAPQRLSETTYVNPVRLAHDRIMLEEGDDVVGHDNRIRITSEEASVGETRVGPRTMAALG